MSDANIVVYAAGGAGINIAGLLEKIERSAGFGPMNPVYIDTSKSNLKEDHPHSRTYIINDLDGSGKVRRENHQQIADCVLDILLNHKPGDLNVVVSSTGGGSGSVIAPSLVNELLARGENVIVVAIGSTDSRIEVDNSIKTLKSYEVIAGKNGRPVPMLYFQNSKTKKRSDVNKDVIAQLSKVSVLFSKENQELDSADLRNWLNYNKVTSYQPHLVALDIYSNEVTKPNGGTVIAVATLAKEGGDTDTGLPVDYQAVGFMPASVAEATETPLHFVLIQGVFVGVIRDLDKIIATLDEVKNASLKQSSIVSDNDKPTDNGLVL